MLLQARFNENGPTNSDITAIGDGLSFSKQSRLYENGARTVFFEPFTNTGLRVQGTSLSTTSNFIGGINDERQYCIYFKFKIDLTSRMSTSPIPILSYLSPNTDAATKWLMIEDNSKFVYYLDNNTPFYTDNCSYVFDGKWHTFLLNRSYGLVQIYLDGFKKSEFEIEGNPNIKGTSAIYIGYIDGVTNRPSFELDDICILDHLVYYQNFIPPNKYWVGEDVIENYHMSSVDIGSYMSNAVADQTTQSILYSITNMDELQLNWVPHHLDIVWHEEDYLYNREQFQRLTGSSDFRAFRVIGLQQDLLLDSNRFIDLTNAKEAVEDGYMSPFLVFVDKVYYKLSDVYVVKSDEYITLFVDGYNNHDKYNRVQSLDIVLIPFKCIYEEGQPVRNDHPIIYSFNDKGLFDIVSRYSIYYKDSELAKEIDVGPILIDHKLLGEANLPDSIWRYGYLILQSLDENTNTAIFRFQSKNNTRRAYPADTVILYRNKTSLQNYQFTVTGADLIKFTFQNPQEYRELTHKLISMQILSESNITLGDESLSYNQNISMKTVIVRATIDHQIEFPIPEVYDNKGNRYYEYLVFKNGVCLNGKGRYELTIDNNIKLTSRTDIMNPPSSLTFVFLKSEETNNQFMLYHPMAKYLYTRTGADQVPVVSGHVSKIKIPEYWNVVYTKNNIIMFANGSLVIPERYEIEDGYVVMKDDYINSYDGQPGFPLNKEVTFVLIKMVTDYDEPYQDRWKEFHQLTKNGHRFILRDLNIDGSIKITSTNLTVFDIEGRYMWPIQCEVFSGNVVKSIKSLQDSSSYLAQYLVCVYSKVKSLENRSHLSIPDNFRFLKEYLMIHQEFFELDKVFKQLSTDYSISLNNQETYHENLTRALFYTMHYNEWLYLDLYKRFSEVQRMTVDPKIINNKLSQNSAKWFLRSEFKDSSHRSYMIFFENGLLPEWYSSIKYDMNTYELTFNAPLDENSDIELFKFHNMNNTLVQLNSKIV